MVAATTLSDSQISIFNNSTLALVLLLNIEAYHWVKVKSSSTSFANCNKRKPNSFEKSKLFLHILKGNGNELRARAVPRQTFLGRTFLRPIFSRWTVPRRHFPDEHFPYGQFPKRTFPLRPVLQMAFSRTDISPNDISPNHIFLFI